MSQSNLAETMPGVTYAEHPIDQPLPVLGEAYGGGFVSAIIPCWPGGRSAIVISADKAEGGDLDDLEWDPNYKASPGATSFLDGLANTDSVNDDRHPAAKAARAWRADHEGDWHLPAHAVQTAILANCCPLWTEIDVFKEGAPQAYEQASYWSSTQSQFASGHAWSQYFGNGFSDAWLKLHGLRVRPVRIVLI